MKPPARAKTDFEKVEIGELIPGVIEDIQYDENHIFKGFNGGEDTKQSGVRFIFALDGYEYKHYSRWMKFNYGERANLFTKYLAKLVPGAVPDMDYDLDGLKGMRVKTIWSEKNDFQSIENIFPEKKAKAGDGVNSHLSKKTPEKFLLPEVDLDGPPIDPEQAI